LRGGRCPSALRLPFACAPFWLSACHYLFLPLCRHFGVLYSMPFSCHLHYHLRLFYSSPLHFIRVHSGIYDCKKRFVLLHATLQGGTFVIRYGRPVVVCARVLNGSSRANTVLWCGAGVARLLSLACRAFLRHALFAAFWRACYSRINFAPLYPSLC